VHGLFNRQWNVILQINAERLKNSGRMLLKWKVRQMPLSVALEGICRRALLNWLSYRSEPGIPEKLQKEFFLLVDANIDPIEELSIMVLEARKYFKNFSEKQRTLVKDIIRNLRRQEHEADKVEAMLKAKILNMDIDPVTIFHMIRLAEIIGSIADHAENAGDMMRAMIATNLCVRLKF